MTDPKLIRKVQPPTMLTIEISEEDLYHILYRLKHQDRLHNVRPDLSEEPRKKLEKLLGRNMHYIVDLY